MIFLSFCFCFFPFQHSLAPIEEDEHFADIYSWGEQVRSVGARCVV